MDDLLEALIPDDWLRSEFERMLSEEDKAKIEAMGGLEDWSRPLRNGWKNRRSVIKVATK